MINESQFPGYETSNQAVRNIAILLHTLPPRTHRALIGQLDLNAKQEVATELESLGEVDVMEQHRVLSSMLDQLRAETDRLKKVESEIQDEIFIGRARVSKKPSSAMPGPIEIYRESASRAADAESKPVADLEPQAKPTTTDETETSPLDFLLRMKLDQTAELLCSESAQTIAVVLSSIQPHTAAMLLPKMPEPMQAEAMRRLSQLGEVSQDTVAEVAEHLQRQLQKSPQDQRGPTLTTSNSAANSAERHTDSSISPARATIPIGEHSRSEAIASEEREAERMASQIDRVLLQLAPKDLCRALGHATTRQAFLVLCGLPNETAETILGMLPRRKSRQVQMDMRKMGQLQLSEIDEAKKAVAEIAIRLTLDLQTLDPQAAAA